eukprot:5061148-Amphidinium_carterae.1
MFCISWDDGCGHALCSTTGLFLTLDTDSNESFFTSVMLDKIEKFTLICRLSAARSCNKTDVQHGVIGSTIYRPSKLTALGSNAPIEDADLI